MKLFDILQLVDSSIKPEDCKVHLACWNGSDDPLDVYLAGEFQEWQDTQTRKNFTRKNIVTLIALPEKNHWLFVGVYEVISCSDSKKEVNCFRYKTREIQVFNEYSGRVVLKYEKIFRQSYPYLETVINDLKLAEIKPEKLTVSAFPGFNDVLISHRVLKSIVRMGVESWKSILSNVKGVYAIIDRSNGKTYVGSATGEDMLWQRWTQYAQDGHGGNNMLKQLMKDNGPNYVMNYQYTILEIADSHTSDKDILKRESFWKNVLCSRKFGYNEN